MSSKCQESLGSPPNVGHQTFSLVSIKSVFVKSNAKALSKSLATLPGFDFFFNGGNPIQLGASRSTIDVAPDSALIFLGELTPIFANQSVTTFVQQTIQPLLNARAGANRNLFQVGIAFIDVI